MSTSGTKVLVMVLLVIIGAMSSTAFLFPIIGWAHLVVCFVWGWFVPEMASFLVGEE